MLSIVIYTQHIPGLFKLHGMANALVALYTARLRYDVAVGG
jgi:hypothetical protein